MPERAGCFRNLLLKALRAEMAGSLTARSQILAYNRGDVLCEPGGHHDHVYFPLSCVISLLAIGTDGDAVETATIGREGADGLATGLHGRECLTRSVVQLSGNAVRIALRVVREEFDMRAGVRDIVMRYAETLLGQAQQTALCNATHSAEARLCRWLLMMQDRSEAETLPLTQEFLASILGANRSTVTLAAGRLQATELIRYHRGTIVIRDRAGLEAASCECYAVVRRQYQRLLVVVALG